MAASKKYEVMFSIAGKVAASFSGAFKGANKALTDANKKTKDLKASMEGLQSLASKGLAIGTIGLAGAAVATKEAIAFESAMADVKKVFTGTDAELKDLNNEILDMSTRLPMAANDIAKIAASAGQAGIATNEISKFTEDAVKMGVAFDISAEEAGQSMAELRTAFKMSQSEVVTLADKINYLGNTTPATAKGITEIVQRIGPLGEVGGFAAGSIAALGATIRGMGVSEEVAATGIKNMMLSMVAGESATKGQKAAYEKLGMNSAQVAKNMQKDAEGTTLAVIKAVSKLEKYEQAATLKELFGSESLGSIAPLLTNLPALEKNLKAVGDATKYAGSMNDEYAARAATTENQIILAKNAINVLAIEIGSTLLPYVNQALEAFKNVIADVRAWSKANPELSASLAKWGVIIAGVIAGVSALALGLVTFIGPIIMVAKTFGAAILVFGKVVMWIKNIAMAVKFLGMVFVMNPVGLAITAIIAVILLLWYNWDTVVKYIKIAWEALKLAFSAGLTAISSFCTSTWNAIKTGFTSVITWFTSLPRQFVEFGLNLLQGLAQGIRQGVKSAVAAAGEAVDAVKNKVKGVFGINSPSKLFAQYGEWNMEGLAIGMQTAAPIAEQASQTAVAPIMPQMNGQSIASGGRSNSAPITITVTQHITGDQNVAEQAQTGLMDAVKQMEAHNNRNNRLSFA